MSSLQAKKISFLTRIASKSASRDTLPPPPPPPGSVGGWPPVLVMLVEVVAVALLVLAGGLADGADHGGVVQVSGLHVLHQVVLLLGGVEADTALPQAAAHTAAQPADQLQDFIYNNNNNIETISMYF